MLVGKWPGGHVLKQLCRPPAPPQTAAPVIIVGTIVHSTYSRWLKRKVFAVSLYSGFLVLLVVRPCFS